MAARNRIVRAAPLLLAFAFTGHLIDVLVLEPRLGFSSFRDFYDAEKLLPVVGHPLWRLSGFYHLLAGVAILILAGQPTQKDHALARYATIFGTTAGLAFMVVFVTNLVGLRELALIAYLDLAEIQPTHSAYLIMRSIVLSSALVFLGLFFIIGNGARVLLASDRMAARYLGLFCGVACLSIPVLPFGAPVMMLTLIAWGVVSGIVSLKQ